MFARDDMFTYIKGIGLVLACGLLLDGPANAANCTGYSLCPWSAYELYSSADGTVQFVVLESATIDGNVGHLVGKTLVSSDGATENAFIFPSEPPGGTTQPVLVATQGFADLGLVVPDFVVPNGFLFTSGALYLRDEPWYIGNKIQYAALPIDGIDAFYPDAWGDSYPLDGTAVAMNTVGKSYTFTTVPLRRNFSGLWWKSPAGSEWGSAIAIEHQGDTVFAAYMTHDPDGVPSWFMVPAAKNYDPLQPNTYRGTAYRAAATGGPTAVSLSAYGTMDFHFSAEPDQSYFSFSSLDDEGSPPSEMITPFVFGDRMSVCTEGGVPGPTPNYQGLWWDPAEPGWGLHLTQQGDTVFGIWLTYDEDTPRDTWFYFVAPKTGPHSYNGDIYYASTDDPSYRCPGTASHGVCTFPVGSATLTFADRNNGTFSRGAYDPSLTKDIKRLIIADPPTICN